MEYLRTNGMLGAVFDVPHYADVYQRELVLVRAKLAADRQSQMYEALDRLARAEVEFMTLRYDAFRRQQRTPPDAKGTQYGQLVYVTASDGVREVFVNFEAYPGLKEASLRHQRARQKFAAFK